MQLANREPWWRGPQWLGCVREKWDAIEKFPEHLIHVPLEEREIPQIALAAQTLSLPLIENISEYIVVCDKSRDGS